MTRQRPIQIQASLLESRGLAFFIANEEEISGSLQAGDISFFLFPFQF
jgi:hypothetical protein